MTNEIEAVRAIGHSARNYIIGEMRSAQWAQSQRKDIDDAWAAVIALVRVLADAPHLDGGARALDASEALRDERLTTWMNAADEAHRALRETHVKLAAAEEALREARVQGMREGADIAMTYLVRGMSKGGALHNVNVAIEAVRKGER